MSLLAIDPGNKQSGYVVLDFTAHFETPLIMSAGIVPNRTMCDVIDEYFRSRSNLPYSTDVAIEMIAAMGMAVGREVFDTCRWVGRFEERCEDGWNARPQLVYRKDVKLNLCGTSRAKDTNIRQALIDRFGAQGRKSAKGPTYGITSHCWAALAVAAYALDNPQEPTEQVAKAA